MKLDLILENTRNKYALGLLEESANLTEIDLLKGRMMINESTMSIRKMLVEEGTMESIKSFLEESWTMALLEEFSAEGYALPEEVEVDQGIPAAALVAGGAGALATGAGLARYGNPQGAATLRRDVAAVRAVPGQVVQAVRQVPVDARAGYTAGMNPTRFARSNPGFAYKAGQAAGGVARPFRG
jgi:hypothetical protein